MGSHIPTPPVVLTSLACRGQSRRRGVGRVALGRGAGTRLVGGRCFWRTACGHSECPGQARPGCRNWYPRSSPSPSSLAAAALAPRRPCAAVGGHAQGFGGGRPRAGSDRARPRLHTRPNPRMQANPIPPPAAYAVATPNHSAIDPTKRAPRGVTPTQTKA